MSVSNVNGNVGTQLIQDLDNMISNLGAGSIQFKFAQMQMKQAQANKAQAEEYMKQIETIQDEQKLVADMVSRARQLQNEAKTGDKCTTMPDDMVKFFKDRGLSWDTAGNDKLHNKDEWEYNIKSLTNYQEQVGQKTQTLMVYLQDFMGQYNSFLEGCKSSIDAAVNTLKTLNQATR